MVAILHVFAVGLEHARGRAGLRKDLAQHFQIQTKRHAKPESDPGQPGFARCQGVLPVRRALDPETSQLRQVSVLLRDTGDGWEVIALDGLEGDLA